MLTWSDGFRPKLVVPIGLVKCEGKVHPRTVREGPEGGVEV